MAEAATANAAAPDAEGPDTANASQQALNMLTGNAATASPEEPEQTVTQEPESKPETKTRGTGEDPDGEDALGDAGKRALERMKTERNNAIRAQKKAEAQLAEANNTIRQMRVEKLASGKLREPALAVKLLTDLNGDEDEKAIIKAIDKLVSEHPYLAPDLPEKDTQSEDDRLAALFPDATRTLKPSDRHQVNADQFGGILNQLGINI